jgi:hypothetical protein
MEMERSMQQMLHKLLAIQEKAEADRIADREGMKQMKARTDDNREREGEDQGLK